MNIDVFNGDADGICALIQLRLAYPAESQLVTGIKRKIDLLNQVSAEAGDNLTVLDIALAQNKAPLMALLTKQVNVFYADHHFAGEIPVHPCLTSLIDTDANVCTSLIINQYLGQQFPAWAVTGAFGDNLNESAIKAAQPLHLSQPALAQLQQLGICINYNAYGTSLEDLHIAPDVLYRQLVPYPSPLDFIAAQDDVYQTLLNAYHEDMQRAQALKPEVESEDFAVFMLPDEKWARRVNGVMGNMLANQYPNRAHAILNYNQRGGFQVSVRAPLTQKQGADTLCSRFPEGGGRKAAAGINHLEKQQIEEFIEAFCSHFK